MIDEVVICGVRRAGALVPMGEIQQAVGRAGRSYVRPGKALVLCPAEDEEYALKCLHDDPPPVMSEMSSVPVVAFHVLPWLDRVHDEESFARWMSRSLAFQQGISISWDDVLSYLAGAGCVSPDLEPTPFGRISIRLYHSPERLLAMRQKLLEARDCDFADPVVLSYVLSCDHVPLAEVEAWELSEYKSSAIAMGFSFERGELIQSYAYWRILCGGIVPKWIRHVCSALKDDLGRTFRALEEVAACEGLPKETVDAIRISGVCAVRRIPRRTAEVMEEFGLESPRFAEELAALGVLTRADLRDNLARVSNEASDALKKELARLRADAGLASLEMRKMLMGDARDGE